MLEYAVKRAGSKVLTGLTSQRHEAHLDRMFELAMTALGSHVLPPVGFEKLLDFSNLHDIWISGAVRASRA